MNHPRYRLTIAFPRRSTCAGLSSGSSTGTAALSELAALGGPTIGSSESQALLWLKLTLAGSAAGVGAGSATLSLIPPTVYHVLLHGQSNATGGNARIFDTAPVAGAYMFNGGLRPGGAGVDLATLVPLQDDNTYSGHKGMSGQSVAKAIAKQLLPTVPNQAGAILVFSCVAVNGAAMSAIAKGTTPYAHAIAQVTALRALSIASGSDYRVLGMVFVHGEADDQLSNASYGAQVLQLQADFDADVKAINGQTFDVPLFACQQAGFYFNNTATSAAASTVQLYNAATANPTKIQLIGSRYVYSHTDGGVHVDVYGNYWSGNRYGRALGRFLAGQANSYIRLVSAAMQAGNTQVLLTFEAPVLPLKWNYSDVMPRPGKGFYFHDDSGNPPEVIDATIEAGNQVRLQLAAASTGAARRVSYARKQIASGQEPVVAFGAAGNLADSDNTLSEGGYPLQNWCPAFNLPL